MKIHMRQQLIEFKSTPTNYLSEILKSKAQGAKRNTTRFVEAPENASIINAQSTINFIGITNTETGERFMRKLTDFRQFNGDGVVVGWFCWLFSW